jgi:hypothetical protein
VETQLKDEVGLAAFETKEKIRDEIKLNTECESLHTSRCTDTADTAGKH